MLDSAGYAELLACRPFLFHRVWDADDLKIESIMSNGLERAYTNYTGFWASRPGHVYMGTRPEAVRVKPKEDGDKPWVLLRICTARLDRRCIDPDEDHFLTHNWVGGELAARGSAACRRLNVPFPPSQWAWEWARYLGTPLCSLGEWAEQVELGRNPAQTRFSVALGRLSYSGVVRPDALSVAEEST
jgi:hypothetical protein